MRRAALLLVLLSATACTQETNHGDPACAFDETGCVPSELVIDVRTASDGPSAALKASSPTEGWVQEGVAATGTEVVVPSTEPGRVAPRIEIAVAGDASRANLRIVKLGPSGPDQAIEVVRSLELGDAPRIVRLDSGEMYVLHVRASLPDGEAGFLFVVRVP